MGPIQDDFRGVFLPDLEKGVCLQGVCSPFDRIEELQDQIGHMTLPLFLTTQIG